MDNKLISGNDASNSLTAADVKESIEMKLVRYFGVKPEEATDKQILEAVIRSVRDILTTKRSYFHDEIKKTHPKRVYYMCMEFLVGCQLKNNIMNLGLGEQSKFSKEYSFLCKETNLLFIFYRKSLFY